MSFSVKPESAPPGDDHRDHVGNHNTRRVFIRRFVAGLAIGVPALRVLAGQTPAYAQTMSSLALQPDPCLKTYIRLSGCGCGSGTAGCSGPQSIHCVCSYVIYSSTVTGHVCGTFSEQNGFCS
jgi:hypothetical protein